MIRIIILLVTMLCLGTLGYAEEPVTISQCVKARVAAHKLQSLVTKILMEQKSVTEEDCQKAYTIMSYTSFEIINSIYVQKKIQNQVDSSA